MLAFKWNNISVFVNVSSDTHEWAQCTLGERPALTIKLMNCSHTLTSSIKGKLPESWMAASIRIHRFLEFPSKYSTSGIGRVPDRLPGIFNQIEVRILTQKTSCNRLSKCDIGMQFSKCCFGQVFVTLLEISISRIEATASNSVTFTVHIERTNSHLVAS